MSESGGMNVNRLTAGGQTVATAVKGNITTLPANLRPTGATTAMNLTWDSDNKLRSADIDANGTADVNFQYDALGRRVARSGTGGSVVYVQMDQQTIADYPVGGAATTPTFRYVYASYIDEPVVRKGPTSTSTVHFYHRNHQYSITAVTTSTGSIAERYAYTAYGQPTILDASASVLSSSAINNRYTYTGREWDATLDLHHFRARWMSGLSGGFLTRDPEGFDGSPYDLYEFANAKALVSVDPSGQWYVYCRNARNFPIFRHCDLRRECTPGEARGPDGNIELISCFPVRKSTDCWRSLNSNACPMRCCDATDQDIENCLTKYPSDNLTGNPGSNCQSNTYERLSRCCLDSNWTPNAYGRPLRVLPNLK